MPQSYVVFFKLGDNVARTPSTALYRYYLHEPTQCKSYEEFEYKVINEEFRIDTASKYLYGRSIFTADKFIYNHYRKDINSLLGKYCTKEKIDKYYIDNAAVNHIELNTILYLLFLNNHEITFDCYSGTHFISKPKSQTD